MIQHRRFYRGVFAAAALYNITWGLLTAIHPQWLFDLVSMEPMRYPAVFACVGMIVGLYGLLYAEVARRPETGFLIAAVALAGKVLGPIGWLWQFFYQGWPLASLVVIITNDLIWWIPFLLYLRDSWAFYREDLRGLRQSHHAPQVSP